MEIKGTFTKTTKVIRVSDGKTVTMKKGTKYVMEMVPAGQPIPVTVNGVRYTCTIK